MYFIINVYRKHNSLREPTQNTIIFITRLNYILVSIRDLRLEIPLLKNLFVWKSVFFTPFKVDRELPCNNLNRTIRYYTNLSECINYLPKVH